MSTEMLWVIVLGCAAATFVWRFLGVIVVKRIDAEGAFFQWISCVSYAMVAGLIFRMIIMPESQLAEVPLVIRIAAVVIAFAVYLLCKQRLVAGVLAGGISLSAMVQWMG